MNRFTQISFFIILLGTLVVTACALPCDFQIKLKGILNEQLSHLFDGLTIRSHSAECTLLTGSIRDQAALHGLLNKIRDMGIPLISVEIIDRTSMNNC